MRPPSKHGLERKYKPWRKGKSSSEKPSSNTIGKSKRKTETSLKNRLRGQKRLLAKLQQNSQHKDDVDASNKQTIDGVQQSIMQLEGDIAAWESKEREKKNAAKYHQVKFIERQKLTRLEKSVKRELQNLQQSNNEHTNDEHQITKLKQELQSIAMDQLYIAFFPTQMKYMALFTNGNNRVVDDERGRKRRSGVWNTIRAGLLQELKKNGGNRSSGDDDRESDKGTAKKMQLSNAKKWVNLDAAKKALLSMPADTYPNAPSADSAVATRASSSTLAKKKSKSKSTQRGSEGDATPGAKNGKAVAAVAAAPDSRFALSKELDGMFDESTTGGDYQKVLRSKESSDESDKNDSDSGSSSSEDDADPLKALKGNKKPKSRSSISKKQVDNSSSSSSSSAPSSSSSDDSSDSSDSDSDSDFDDEPPLKNTQHPQKSHNIEKEEEDDDGGHDDFFSTNKISTEDVFTQAQNTQKKNHSKPFDDEQLYQKGRPDKSRGFRSQNQSKGDYKEFQRRQKRMKFG